MLDEADHHMASAAFAVHIPGHRRHTGQRAGFDARVADGTLPASRGAVHPGQGQGGDQVGHGRAGPQRLQPLPQAQGGAALRARQPRAVVEHQVFRAARCGRVGGGLAHRAGGGLRPPQRQKQLPSHHVVAELVDVAHHLGQGLGGPGLPGRGVDRPGAGAHLTVQLAPQLLPGACQQAGRKVFTVSAGPQYGPGLGAATQWIGATHAHLPG